MDADRIVVLEKGIIVEEGTYNELILAEGRFFKMWTEQTTTPSAQATLETDKHKDQTDLFNP